MNSFGICKIHHFEYNVSRFHTTSRIFDTQFHVLNTQFIIYTDKVGLVQYRIKMSACMLRISFRSAAHTPGAVHLL